MDPQAELLEAQAQIWSWALSHIVSMSRKCALELGIPDAIHTLGGSAGVSLHRLVSVLGIPRPKAEAFGCLMRILSTRSGGLFFSSLPPRGGGDDGEEEGADDVYSLTPASRLLVSRDAGQPLCQSAMIMLQLHPAFVDYQASCLATWLLRRDGTAFEIAKGVSFWDYVAGAAGGGQGGEVMETVFYEAMVCDSKLISGAALSRCKEVFQGIGSLVDVGGGTGALAAAIGNVFPEIKCSVLDLPRAVELQHQEGSAHLHHPNLDFIDGDMFHNVPSADAVLLKWVIHDWDDEQSIKLLKLCREAVAASSSKAGKVIIIDVVRGYGQNSLPSMRKDLEVEVQDYLDMLMMSLLNGRERDEKQWNKLLVAAGFSSFKIYPVLGVRSLIEAFP